MGKRQAMTTREAEALLGILVGLTEMTPGVPSFAEWRQQRRQARWWQRVWAWAKRPER